MFLKYLFNAGYQLPLAPPPPEEPPLKPPKLLPDEPPLLHPPPLPEPEDLVRLGIFTTFLSWKLQYLHVLSTSFSPEEVYVAALSFFTDLYNCGSYDKIIYHITFPEDFKHFPFFLIFNCFCNRSLTDFGIKFLTNRFYHSHILFLQ